jgi:hypothetical protein
VPGTPNLGLHSLCQRVLARQVLKPRYLICHLVSYGTHSPIKYWHASYCAVIAFSWRLSVCLVGAGTSVPELPISFLEHAQYDRVLMHSKRMADLNWWCTQLAGAPLEPLLTTDYPRSGRPNIGQNQGDIVKVCTRLLLSQKQADEVRHAVTLM